MNIASPASQSKFPLFGQDLPYFGSQQARTTLKEEFAAFDLIGAQYPRMKRAKRMKLAIQHAANAANARQREARAAKLAFFGGVLCTLLLAPFAAVYEHQHKNAVSTPVAMKARADGNNTKPAN